MLQLQAEADDLRLLRATGSALRLAHQDRLALRAAVDAGRRQQLHRTQASGLEPSRGQCGCVSLSGRPCLNRPGPDGFCGVHTGGRCSR